MSAVLAEETAALHAAQAECTAALRRAAADCTRRAALEADRQTRTRQRPALEQAASEADRSAAAQAAQADALEQQIAGQRSALPYPSEPKHRLRWMHWKPAAPFCAPAWSRHRLPSSGQSRRRPPRRPPWMPCRRSRPPQHRPCPHSRWKICRPGRPGSPLPGALCASRNSSWQHSCCPTALRQKKYRAAAAARTQLEQRWQWVSALAATAGGTLTSKQKIRLEAYIQMNYLDRILRHANTRLMQMTAGQYELERIGAENQRSQSGLDLGVIDHYNGTRRNVKTLSGGEASRPRWRWRWAFRTRCRAPQAASGWTPSFWTRASAVWTRNRWNRPCGCWQGLTEGDRLVGIISHVSALKDRIDRQVVVRKARTGGSTVELIV